MKIGGLQKFSLIDYPGKISAVIFVQGCNFRCPFCHNRELVVLEYFSTSIEETYILDFLKDRKGKLQGVVITGGEPTIFPDLLRFIRKIKELEFQVKLDTNGSNPEMIKILLKENLIDYIAMDIKAPLKRYRELTGFSNSIVQIKKSIELIKYSNISYEFRTTLIKGLFTDADIFRIVSMIKGAKRYVFQNFYPAESLINENFKKFIGFEKNELERFKKIAEKYVKKVVIRY